MLRSPTFLNDYVNWLVPVAPYIVSLVLEKESYQILSRSVFDDISSCLALGTLRGCFSLLIDRRDKFSNVWTMFLFNFQFQNEKPWMPQLSAVCLSLSLAAKVEENQVPILLELQVEESRYFFEAKTIKKMEILVLSRLGWNMNPTKPLSFIDYMIRRFGLKDLLCWEFLHRCEDVVLSVIILDSKFMSYLPSVLATVAMIHVFNSVEPSLGDKYKKPTSKYSWNQQRKSG
ncbi:hypothetical protein RYX36_021390 [Vicia faba]